MTSVTASTLFTVRDIAGETNTTTSRRFSAIAMRFVASVTSSDSEAGTPMIRLTSTVSASLNRSYAVCSSPTEGSSAEPLLPPERANDSASSDVVYSIPSDVSTRFAVSSVLTPDSGKIAVSAGPAQTYSD